MTVRQYASRLKGKLNENLLEAWKIGQNQVQPPLLEFVVWVQSAVVLQEVVQLTAQHLGMSV